MKICEYCNSDCEDGVSACPACGGTYMQQLRQSFQGRVLSELRRKGGGYRKGLPEMRHKLFQRRLPDLRLSARGAE